MLVAGLDIETTGLNTEDDRVIELAVIVWDSTDNSILDIYDVFIFNDRAISEEITKLTGIKPAHVSAWGKKPFDAFTKAAELLNNVDVVAAHNGSGFDKPFLQNEFRRHGLAFPQTPWLDTSVDVDYSEQIATRKLSYLALEHGFINPFPHRAFSDVLTMLKVLSNYDMEKVFAASQEKKVSLLAVVKAPWQDSAPEGKKDADIAKSLGYRWNGTIKKWVKIVRESKVAEEKQKAPFEIITG